SIKNIDKIKIECYYIQGASELLPFCMEENNMSYEKLTKLQSRLIIGTKQTIKAIEQNRVDELFVAEDADKHITEEVIRLANKRDVKCTTVDSKKDLGAACGIEVGATAVAVAKEGSKVSKD